jgi:hypothetical protein
VCKPGSGWQVIRISAFDTPAYTDEEVPEELYADLLSAEWVDERKKRWAQRVRSIRQRSWASSRTSPTTA